MQRIKKWLKKRKWFMYLFDSFKIWSIRSALKEQGLYKWYDVSKKIIDISNQYNDLEIDSRYLDVNVRGMHSLQMELMQIVAFRTDKKKLMIVDIGDSCGNHIKYFDYLFHGDIDSISINPDIRSVNKIKKKGMIARCLTAEDYIEDRYENPDLIMMFETLEHLEDPIRVLKRLNRNDAQMIITVPFLRQSRVAIPKDKKGIEDIHIFELSADDWDKIFKYCGWDIIYSFVYYQYPDIPFISWLLKRFWKRYDYEGFYGVVLG
jgi:hypothetical protein